MKQDVNYVLVSLLIIAIVIITTSAVTGFVSVNHANKKSLQSETKILELENKIEKSSVDLDTAEKLKTYVVSREDSLKGEIEQKETQKQQLSQNIGELQKQVSISQNNYIQATREIQRLKEDINDILRDLKEIRDEKNTLESENSDLKERVDELEAGL